VKAEGRPKRNPTKSRREAAAQAKQLRELRALVKKVFKKPGEWEKSIRREREFPGKQAGEKGIQAREAKHGEKMIEVRLRFWTDELASGSGRILPKHAWSSGVVRIEGNDSHGIKPSKPRPFNSLLDVGAAIEKLRVEHGVVLHPSRSMCRYFPSSD
jgi:hypothetical protein